MARSYYHDAVGALLVYDVTSRASFSAVEQWLGDARQLATPGVVVILVGNKKDLQVMFNLFCIYQPFCSWCLMYENYPL